MKIYGLIGYPLGHSFSRAYFSQKFSEEGLSAVYKNFEIPELTDLRSLVESEPDLAGLNVTIPYKSAVLPGLDSLDPLAAEIGAVNVIRIIRDGKDIKLAGYNTDILGFRESLMPLLKHGPASALVLGTGGASLAVKKCLKDEGISFLMVSRSSAKGDLQYGDLTKSIIESYPVIINTTPLGMFPDISGCPDIPYRYLSDRNILFDLVYNPEITTFLSQGKERGCIVKGGSEMLHLQAEASWEIWNKK